MIITLAGDIGSGKTTVGEIIARKLGYNFYSIGNLRGKMASDRGMTLDELNKLGESEDWTDKEIDAYQEDLGKREDDFIIDGRLAWYFIPHSFKVFLGVDKTIGAKRIFRNQRSDEKKIGTVKEMMNYISERRNSDKKRYKKYYGVNPYDRKNYDVYLNTTNLTVDEEVDWLMKKIEKLKNNQSKKYIQK